jgi:hypothetical protein
MDGSLVSSVTMLFFSLSTLSTPLPAWLSVVSSSFSSKAKQTDGFSISLFLRWGRWGEGVSAIFFSCCLGLASFCSAAFFVAASSAATVSAVAGTDLVAKDAFGVVVAASLVVVVPGGAGAGAGAAGEAGAARGASAG